MRPQSILTFAAEATQMVTGTAMRASGTCGRPSSPLRVAGAGLLALAVLPLGACTRTYDGTIVPTYQTQFVREGVVPRMVVRRTPVDPATPLGNYPPMPRAPEAHAVTVDPSPRRAARPRGAPVVTQTRASAAPLTCRQVVSPGGRVRVVCE